MILPVFTLAAALSVPAAAPVPGGPQWKTIQDGIALSLAIEPLDGKELREGRHAALRFQFSDAGTGQPLSGLNPAAWLDRLKDGETLDPKECVQKVEEFVGGSILKRPTLDLNVYYVLTLNADSTISVVDPLFGFGGTKLLALVPLLSPGEDWTLTEDQGKLFVTQPEAGRVAVVETAGWKVLSQVDAGARPTRLALQPDGAYLWVGLDGGSGAAGVAVLDTRTLRVVARIPTGPGHHEIALSDDSRHAFVTNQEGGTVSVIDVARLRKVRDVKTGDRPVSIAWSSLAGAAYVTHEGDGTIVAVEGKTLKAGARMRVQPGVGQIKVAPGKRLAFAVNPRTDALYIIDLAANRVVQTGEMRKGPDQVSFSEFLAYVRHRESETVLMVPLSQVGDPGKSVPVVDFPGGEHPFGRGKLPSAADAIVRAPGPTAMLVANPADRAVYYYREGMAAPMGSFRNYDREPRAALVVDRSLQERGRGTYQTVTKLPPPGRYQVALFLDAPRMTHCFEAEIVVDPELEAARRRAAPVRVEPLVESPFLTVGREVRLRFRLTDPNTGEPRKGVSDFTVMAFPASGAWQRRWLAREVGDGLYEVTFVPSEPGAYTVQEECPSGRLPFHLSPRVLLRADPAKPADTANPTQSP
ncbi:MAG TPA: YncE family protein [Thermoanaerobaculia bacterium]|jgi:YVTN family beta-propeller protein|nr:YncE family protein [Thermoanaerobaculia bacterium]